MSGARGVWTDGQAVTTDDLQRMADAGAAGDDRAQIPLAFHPEASDFTDDTTDPYTGLPYAFGGGVQRHPTTGETLYPSGGTRRYAMCLRDDLGTQELLTLSSSSTGNLSVKIAAFYIQQPTAPVVIATRTTESGTLVFASNATGDPRRDHVYARVYRDATVEATRVVKSPTTGVVSSQTLTVETQWLVEYGVVQGTPGVSPALETLPADGTNSYYVSLADVTVPNGYTTGGSVSRTNVIPTWSRARYRRNTVNNLHEARQDAYPPTNYDRSGGMPGWFGSIQTYYFAFTPDTGTSNPTCGFVIPGGSKYRYMRATVFRPVNHTGYPGAPALAYPRPTDTIAAGGESYTSGWFFTGDGAVGEAGTSFASPIYSVASAFGLAGAGDDLRVYLDSTSGLITVGFSGSFGVQQHFLVLFECTDRVRF